MGFIAKMLKPKVPTIVMPQAPTPSAPAVMPDTDATEVKRAQKLEMTRRMQRSGRASTILSTGTGSAGGDDFGSPRLGG